MRTDPSLLTRPAGSSAVARVRGSWLPRGDVLPVLLLALLPAVVFGIPALLGHAVVPGDDMTQNFPLRELAGSQLRAGHLPLYDPWIWSGAPLLGGWNAAAAYPLTWLFAILPGTAAWTAGLILTWETAGLGMFCFLRALRLGRLAGFLGALSFAFAGAMSAQVSHFGLVAGMSWVPLVLLAILRLCRDSAARGARFRWIAVLTVSAGLVILAGEPRAVDDALVIVLGYATWMIARLGRDWFRAAVSVAAGLALGACLGAVQWLPGLAAVSTSQRAGGSVALFDSGSLPVRWLLLTLVPDLLGGSGSLRQPAFFSGYNLTEVTSYVGILPLVAAFALLGRLRPGRGLSRWPEWIVWHIIGLAGAVLALGGNTPLGPLLYRLPLFGGQRLQSRNILVLDLALAVLLAYWADQPAPAPRLRRGLPGFTRGRTWPETALGAIPAIAVAAVAVLGLTRGPALLHWLGIGLSRAASVSGQLRPSLIPYAVLGAAAGVLVIVMRRLGPRSRPRLLAGFVAVDLVVFTVLCVVAVGGGTPARAGTADAGSRPAAASAPVRPVAALGYQGRFAIYDPDLLDAGELAALGPPDLNSTGATAMPSVQGYSSLADGRYAAATGTHLATGEGQDMLSPRAVEDGTLDQLDTSVLLTLAGYLITPAHDGAQAAGLPAAGPAGTGSRRVAAGQRTTWYLGSPVQVAKVTVPDRGARQDAAAGTRIGLTAPGGQTRWFTARAVSATELAITVPGTAASVAVTAQAGRAPSELGAPVVVTGGGSALTADGQLQNALVPPRWTYAGLDGSFAVFTDRLARAPLTIQPLRGQSVRGSWVKDVSGTPAEPAAATVFTPHGARVVRSVAAIPGWTATWDPRDGRSVTLAVAVDGLVQAVDVPPGLGTLVFSYNAPDFTAGFAASLAALVILTGLLLAAALSRTAARRAAQTGLPGRMGHGVDDRGNGQEQHIILAGRDLDPVGIPGPEPSFGHLGDLGPVALDGVLVVDDVALDVQVRAVFHLRYPPLPQRRDHGFFDDRDPLPVRPFDLHAVPQMQHPFLDLAQFTAVHVLEQDGLPDPQRLAV